MAVAFASAAAVLFASASVTAKRGMQHMNVATALVISLTVTAAITGVAVAFDPPDQVHLSAVGLFIGAGLIGDGIGRFSSLGGVDRLGPSTAVPIQTAAYPVMAMAGGVLVLSESVAPAQLLGAGLVIGGIWALTGPGIRRGGPSSAAGRTRHPWSAVALPIIAGVGFGISDLFRKAGLDEVPNPAFGALTAVLTVLVAWIVAATALPALRRQLRPGPGWQWLVASGLFTALALLAVFKALDAGTVSAVGPIVAAQPLAVITLSWLILRDLERVKGRMVAGGILTVAGVVLIAVSA